MKKSFFLIICSILILFLLFQIVSFRGINSKEMIKMIDSGHTIVIEVPKPSYEVSIKGEKQEEIKWIQLDQLKTDNSFRQEVDRLFNINIVTENGINGKSGCMYVDEAGDRNGNTTLEDSFRNKVFMTKYWSDTNIQKELINEIKEVYSDLGDNEKYSLMAVLNSYYNLLPDYENPNSFNATQSLSREQFFTLVFKADEGVKELYYDDIFDNAIGGRTQYSKYAVNTEKYSFLKTSNKSLDKGNYNGNITRAEAVYIVVNKHFAEQLSKVTGKEKAYSDTKNAGDLALKAGFKTKENGAVKGKDRWQAYTLAYMEKHPDDGMQEELYKAMVVAKQVGLISGDESRWDEPISKAEAIELMTKVYEAKNKIYGYLSSVEYGKMNESKFTENTEEAKVMDTDERGMKSGKGWVEQASYEQTADPNKVLSSGVTLGDAKKIIEEFTKDFSHEYSKEDWAKECEKMANDMGTTMEEINRCKLPSTTTASTSKNNTTTSKSNTSKSSKTTIKSNTSTKTYKSELERVLAKREMYGGDESKLTVEEQIILWESLPDWQKEFTLKPGGKGEDGRQYWATKEEIPEQWRNDAVYTEGKGWHIVKKLYMPGEK